MIKRNLTTIVVLIFCTLVTGQQKQKKRQIKEEKSVKEYIEIQETVDSKSYVFELNRVNAINFPTLVNFVGEGYFMKISKDSVEVFLPYFGRQFSSINYGSSGGMDFNGSIEGYIVECSDAKKKVVVKFDSRNKEENFEVMLEIYKNGRASLIINSTNRSSISYSGKVLKSDKVSS